jgi:hypothetical protein
MADLTGKSSHEFPERLDDRAVMRMEDALATHGARVDAKAQTFTPDPAPTYTFACTLEVSDQMAADNTAALILGRALYDCGYPPTRRRPEATERPEADRQAGPGPSRPAT